MIPLSSQKGKDIIAWDFCILVHMSLNKISFPLVFCLSLLCLPSGFAQIKFDPQLLTDPKANGPEIAAGLKTKEVIEYAGAVKNCIYLKNGFRSARFLNEQEWLRIKDTVIPYRVDVVYSKYPLRNGVYQEVYPLLFKRLNTLFAMDPDLNDAQLEWNKIWQTHCINDEQVNTLFHGVVIWYRTEEKEKDSIPAIKDPPSRTDLIETEQEHLVSEQNSFEELEVSVQNILSSAFISDSLKKVIESQPLEMRIKTLRNFLEKEIQNEPETVLKNATEKELKSYNADVEDFLKKYPASEKVVLKVLDRHPEWKSVLVINDWTGSMYGYGAQVLEWHLKNIEKSGIISLTLFNDGDSKKTENKKVGETGGIYSEKADNIKRLVKLFNLIMMKGSGGDGPENDVEGILKAMEEFDYYSEIVLIADNNACIRDIELADRIGKPVKVIVCGYDPKMGINPDLVYLAKVTGGGIYTLEGDLENIHAETGSPGEIKTLTDPRFKMISKKCGDLAGRFYGEVKDYDYAKKHVHKVRKLTMAGMSLDAVPKKVFRMKKLKYLDLSNNAITIISPKIERLEYLQAIDLSHNQLSALPKELGKVIFIQQMNLSHNQFKTIPAQLSSMNFLLKLDLSNNQIDHLEKILKLKKITDLNLSHNNLSEIQRSIGSLRTLKSLNLSDNSITKLPENFATLGKLERLDLSNNKLAVLPKELYRMRSLKWMDLRNNNFSAEEKERIQKAFPKAEILF